MILQSTVHFELEYLQNTSVLKITWFDIKELPRQEVESVFAIIREAIRKYAVAKLLVDASRSEFLFDKEALAHVSSQYLMALAGTSIKKVARIASLSPEREKQYLEIQKQAFLKKSLSIQFQNFENEKNALEWLASSG